MALETATYISDLVSTNPTSSDGISQGDDHIRLLKATLKATFPNVSGACTASHTELNHVDGVTSSIQSQLDAKAPLLSPTFTGTVVLPATTSVGSVSAAELGHLDGVTSSIQTQLNAKANTSSLGTAAALNVGTSANNVVQLDSNARLPSVEGTTPTGALMPFAGSSAPSGWLLCFGQQVSRSTYAALFAVLGTAYGTGDGSTTFNLPDLRGRTVAGRDNMGGSAASRLTAAGSGVAGDTLGASGGAETHVLTTAQIPAHQHFVANTVSTTANLSTTNTLAVDASYGSNASYNLAGSSTTATLGLTSSVGTGAAHNNVQPTIILNYIIKT